jgi:glycosyltransferase involved in cell wall biosynthesis
MKSTIAYDLSRLIWHYTAPAPNGIDRVDLAYARHFLCRHPKPALGVCLGGLWPATVDAADARPLLAAVDRHWHAGGPGAAEAYRALKARLLGGGPATPQATLAASEPTLAPGHPAAPKWSDLIHLAAPGRWRRTFGGRLPAGATFIHATHIPFDGMFGWLSRRPDIRAVFFVHDLLALHYPEYFRPWHAAQHRRALEIVARRGHAAIVCTHVVAAQLTEFLRQRGRDMPILVEPMPPDPAFAASGLDDPDLRGSPYFVMCGTIEPRKNHLTVLQAWRELARHEDAPKLLIIGRRGWENENVLDMLERSEAIRRHVIAVADLPTAAVARLIANARALLMPSFAEGYGLPVVEALALGTPVIASDIAVFREVAGARATYLHPLDGLGWLAAIAAHTQAPRKPDAETGRPEARAGDADYFTRVEAMLSGL